MEKFRLECSSWKYEVRASLQNEGLATGKCKHIREIIRIWSDLVWILKKEQNC